jgi:uncharacterized membrane protein YGL010W
MLKHAYDDRLKYYRSKHTTVGCKVTHMFGIPLIATSVFVFPFNKRLAINMQLLGWMLQFIGHCVFEHNKPVLFEKPGPLTAVAALVFIKDEWSLFASGQEI